jgi:hypothetical protein
MGPCTSGVLLLSGDPVLLCFKTSPSPLKNTAVPDLIPTWPSERLLLKDRTVSSFRVSGTSTVGLQSYLNLVDARRSEWQVFATSPQPGISSDSAQTGSKLHALSCCDIVC